MAMRSNNDPNPRDTGGDDPLQPRFDSERYM